MPYIPAAIEGVESAGHTRQRELRSLGIKASTPIVHGATVLRGKCAAFESGAVMRSARVLSGPSCARFALSPHLQTHLSAEKGKQWGPTHTAFFKFAAKVLK